MAFSFKSEDATVAAGLRRIASSQIDDALDESEDGDLPMAERIHQLRKRCKKLRGLIRLVRPALDAYKTENRAFRDIARSLSDVRDAAAMVETCDRVCDRFDGQLADGAFATIRARLAETAHAREQAGDVSDRLDAARADLRAARQRAADWSLDTDGADAITGGLAKTFDRARDAMDVAQDSRDPDDLHEWRKRAKYHWYHLRLLKSVSPVIAAQVDPADALSDTLGDHHDLHVMTGVLDDHDDLPTEEVEMFRALAAQRQATLEHRAFDLGTALFSEKPNALARRVEGYWSAWSA